MSDVDAILCHLQELVEETASMRFRSLPVRVGVGGHSGLQLGRVGDESNDRVGAATLAKLIEFDAADRFSTALRIQFG